MKCWFSFALAVICLLFSCADQAPATGPQLPITDNGDGTYNYGKTKLKKDTNGVYFVDGSDNAPAPKNVNGVTILTPAEAKKAKEKKATEIGLKRGVSSSPKSEKRKNAIRFVDPPATATQAADGKEPVKIDPVEEFRKNNPQLYDQEREEARLRAQAKIQAAAGEVKSYKVDSTTNNSPDPILPPQYLELKRRAEQGDSESQYQLGVALKNGLGGERDVVAARQWLEKAAAQGHVKARLVLNGRW